MRRLAEQELAEPLTWHVPPSCGGQIIEVAYAAGEDVVFRRETDQSYPVTDPDRVTYYYADVEDVEGAWEPWNGEPEVTEWREVAGEGE